MIAGDSDASDFILMSFNALDPSIASNPFALLNSLNECTAEDVSDDDITVQTSAQSFQRNLIENQTYEAT